MKKIYIVTAHTGYNYGTYLQAYSMKKFVSEFADQVDIVWEKSFGPNGRDLRLKKMITIIFRTILNYRQASIIKQGYSKNFEAEPNEHVKRLFDLFSVDYLKIVECDKTKLKELSKNSDTIAVIAGSDQIWNASSMYPDPLYYLQFVPKLKRVAYAPSFGRTDVPLYNKKIITKYLKSIPALSVREESGAKIIRNLTGRKAPVVPDPTLVVDWSDWISANKEDYILLYFLDKPTNEVLSDIKNIKQKTSLKIKVMLHEFDNYAELGEYEMLDAGPKEFVNFISKSRFVCTDSYHASIFSILSETPFYTYDRNYGKVDSQSSRIESLLGHYELSERFRKEPGNINTLNLKVKMAHVKRIREKDYRYAHGYMKWALSR